MFSLSWKYHRWSEPIRNSLGKQPHEMTHILVMYVVLNMFVNDFNKIDKQLKRKACGSAGFQYLNQFVTLRELNWGIAFYSHWVYDP